MVSAAFTVNSAANPAAHSVSFSSTVTLALTSVVGATSIDWTIMGCSDPDEALPALTYSGSTPKQVATFTMPADSSDDLGRTFLVRCVVSSETKNADGATQSATEYAVIGAPNVQGLIPIAPGEKNYRHGTHGWGPEVNIALANSSSGATVVTTTEVDIVLVSNDTLSGLTARDGVTPVNGVTRVLATAQTTTANNGPWLANTGAWTRPTDFVTDSNVVPGTSWQVTSGTLGANTTWRLKSGSTIAGAKVVERIDSTPLYIDATRPPYNVGSSQTSALNTTGVALAIADADAAGGRTIKLPPAFNISTPIVVNQRLGVVLEGPTSKCTISPSGFSGGPAIYFGGYDIGTFEDGAGIGSSDTFSLQVSRLGADEHYVDITGAGILINPAIANFGIRFQALFTDISTSAGVLVSCQGNRAVGDTFTKLFKITTNTSGSVSFLLRLRAADGTETETTVTTATGCIVADSTTKYQIEGNYDSTKIRLFVTKMLAGQASCDPALNGADASAGVRGYAETTPTAGVIEQYPWEHIHYGQAMQFEFPSGALLQHAPGARLGRIALSAKAVHVAQHTPGAGSIAFSAGPGGNKDFYGLLLNASSQEADGELLKGNHSLTDGSTSTSGTNYAPVRGGDSGAANSECGIRNIKINTSGGTSYALTGFLAVNSPQSFVENFECTAGFMGIWFDNNSYNSRISDLTLGGKHIALGLFAGLINVSGTNRISGEENTIIIALRSSGEWSGTTYITALPTAWAGMYVQTSGSTLRGLHITDENNSRPYRDCALYLAAPSSGNHDTDLRCNIELFGDGGLPIRVRSAVDRTGTKFRVGGRIVNFDRPRRPLVLFDGDPNNVDEITFTDMAYSGGNRLTNCPGKVRDTKPAASIVAAAQIASIATVPLFTGENLVVRAASTANVASLSGTGTFDGVALIATDVILLKDQSTPSQNGPWTINAGAWTRPTAFDTSAEVLPHYRIRVREGTASANKTFKLYDPTPFEETTYVLGTSSLTWTDDTDIPVAGLWAINVMLQCTTADAGAGTVKATIGWTDAAGATTRDTSLLPLSATGRLNETFICDSTGLASLTYSTTVATIGTSQYRIRITADKVPE